MKNKYIYVLLLIIALVYHSAIFGYGYLTHGDWLFFYNDTLNTIRINYFSLWLNDYGFGRVLLDVVQAPSYALYGFLSKITNWDYGILERLIHIFPYIILNIFGSYFLVKKITKSSVAGFIGAIVFSFNTYILVLQTGHLTLATAFSFGSFIILFFIKTLEEKKIKFAVITAILGFLCGAYEFRAFYIIAWILFFYYLFYSFVFSKFTIKSFIRNSIFAVLPIVLILFLNMYWIIGLGTLGTISDNDIFNRSLFGNGFMNILQSLTLFHPFWTGSEPSVFVVNQIPLYFWLIPVFAFLGMAVNRKNKNIIFFGIISLLGIFLSKQVGKPFPDFYEWMYLNFPGFNAFRESSKFFYLVALGYSVLIGSFVGRLFDNINKNNFYNKVKWIITIIICFVFLINTKSIITGEIGTLFVYRQIPQDYNILNKYIIAQNGSFRSLYIPRISRWSNYTDQKPAVNTVETLENNWKTVLDFKGGYSPDIIVGVLSEPFSDSLFDISSIKYVIVPVQDIQNNDDFFLNYGGNLYPDIKQRYTDKISTVSWLKRIDIGTKEMAIFENENYKPHIYQTLQSDSINNSQPFKSIDSYYISPTEYKLSLKNLSGQSFLNFGETYHTDWSLKIGNFNQWEILSNKNYFLDNSFHLRTDANLNSWLIDTDFIKNNIPPYDYTLNSDGSVNIDITLYFKPQSYFNIGLIISGGVFIILILYLFYECVISVKRKYSDKNL